MSNNLSNNCKWTLITIVDSKGLPGKSIFDMIHALLKSINFKFVVIDDIIGARISNLVDKENIIMEMKDLLKIIQEVLQFDWGDFFLFKEYPNNWINSKDLGYPEIIVQTNTTIRAIDGGYIYVYTPYQEIISIIMENYEIESIKIDNLENLDYPY